MEEFLNNTQNRIIISVLLVPGLVYAIYSLRERHPGHVYTIWYAHWFTTTWVSALFFYIWYNARILSNGPLGTNGTLSGWVVWFFESSLNLRHEAYFLVTIYVIFLLPQIIAFLTAGISGCANNLIVVRPVTTILTWFVIKSFAVLSGIFLAQSIACFYADPLLLPKDFPKRIATSIMMLSLSFIAAAFFYKDYSFRTRKKFLTVRNRVKSITDKMKFYTMDTHDKSQKRQQKIRYRYFKNKIKGIARNLLEY